MARQRERFGRRLGISPPAAAIIVVVVICASAIGIVEIQTSSSLKGSNSAKTTTITLTQTLTSTVAVNGTQQSSQTTQCCANPQVAVTGVELSPADFLAGGSTKSFTCAASPAMAYLTLTNTGVGNASVVSVSFTWAGANTVYTLTGNCGVGAAGSATETTYVIFPATTKLTPSAVAGQAYAGTVTLSNGAQLFFTGTWQGGQAQAAVTGTALIAADLLTGGSTTTFTCAAASSLAYLTLTNTGTESASVVTLTITWAGANTAFTLSGSCNIGASGSATATQYVIFPATTKITPSAVAGQTYTGTVTLSNGAVLLFTGTWQ